MPGQTLANLEFMLEKEARCPDVERFWLVNRILDPVVEAAVVECLEAYGERFERIPFVPAAFSAIEGADSEALRHNRCLYLMNVNAARNALLVRGRQRAAWCAPLDGSCTFTEDGLERLLNRLRVEHRSACLAVPSYRIGTNSEFRAFDPEGRDAQEPQLVMGCDSTELFDPDLRYGLRSKVELLRRLAFEHRRGAAFQVVDEDRMASYVVRLASGVPEADGHWRDRARLRERGIDELLARAARAS